MREEEVGKRNVHEEPRDLVIPSNIPGKKKKNSY